MEKAKKNEEFYMGHSDMHDFTLRGEGFLYCEQGESDVVVDFQNYKMTPGSLLYLTPDLHPHFLNQSEEFQGLYWIATERFLDRIQYGLPVAFYDHISLHPMMVCDDHLLSLIRLLHDYYNTEMQASRQLILTDLAHAFFLAYELKVMETFEIDRDACPAHIERQCRHFYLLVQKHFREHRDVGFYAGELCVTANYLAVIIRKYCRETPKLAITRQTISEIKYQLIYTSKTIEQIAKELHFPDSSYMCRYFRRATGRALDEYRREMK